LCQGQCGVDDGSNDCQCNSACSNFGDCCSDYHDVCYTCQGRCGETYLHSRPCHCNDDCRNNFNCCDDYTTLCSGGGPDEVTDLTEQMFAADVNAVLDQLTLDYQGQGGSGDLASGPLFTDVPASALSGPTYTTLQALQDNYIPSVTKTEVEDSGEVAEQDAFLDAVMDTEVMQLAESFLHRKNLLTGSLRSMLDQLWFTMYSRYGHTKGSSGFEHIFVGEVKDGDVSGFHNWVYFQDQEAEGELDYEGYTKIVHLGSKAEIMSLRFNWLTEPKSSGSMFIGTSPELEMATYSVCFLAYRNDKCPVQMNGYEFNVKTFDYGGMMVVGSAYPMI